MGLRKSRGMGILPMRNGFVHGQDAHATYSNLRFIFQKMVIRNFKTGWQAGAREVIDKRIS